MKGERMTKRYIIKKLRKMGVKAYNKNTLVTTLEPHNYVTVINSSTFRYFWCCLPQCPGEPFVEKSWKEIEALRK